MEPLPPSEPAVLGPQDAWAACGARLQALDPQQALRVDPIRWHAAQALWQQAQKADGALRGAIVRRLLHHLDGLAQSVSDASLHRRHDPRTPPQERAIHGSWRASSRPWGAPLASLEPMRQTHARLKVRQQLRHTLAQPLQHAGPLHSERLVQQSLARLNEWSEAYLHRFMSYLEALAVLEDAQSLVRAASAASVPKKPRARVKAMPATRR